MVVNSRKQRQDAFARKTKSEPKKPEKSKSHPKRTKGYR